MPIANTTIKVDWEIWEEAKKIIPNRSAAIRDYLKELVDRGNKDFESIDISEKRLRLNQLQKQLSKIKSEIGTVQSDIERWEELREKKNIESLKKQKEDIEKQTRCNKCGELVGSKPIHLNGSIYCRDCYMNI